MQFKDKHNRTIQLKDAGGMIEAYCADDGEAFVGSIQFHIQSFGDKYTKDSTVAIPEIANICERYQRSGIATQIIEYAKTIYDDVYFSPDMGCGGKSDQIHYSDAGLAFKNSCERNGITRDVLLDED